jgi:hypothetical protein
MAGPRLARAVALAVLASAAVPALAAVVRPPYLQSVTATSAVVVFRSDTRCPAVVRYGKGALDREVASPAATTHAVALAGLVPGTTYQYAVEVCGTTVASGKRLRTAPGADARTVHFAATGDFGTGSAAQAAVGEAIAASAPELIVSVGDVVYDDGTEAELDARLFGMWGSLLGDVPMFTIIGNHEYRAAGGGPYFAAFHLPTNNPSATEKYYSFDWGPVHFAGLDSNCSGGLETADCSIALQKAWLDADLAATSRPWKVVFLHHPQWSSGEHGSSTVARQFVPILEKHGVDLVLTGHDHDYERSRPMKGTAAAEPGTPGAVTYVVVGNGGAALRAFRGAQPAWTAYRNDSDHGFLDVKVEGGVLSAEMRSTAGAVKDSFRIEKEVPAAPVAPGTAPVSEPGGGPPAAPAAGADAGAGGGADVPVPENVAQGGCGMTSGSAGTLGLALVAAWALLRRHRRQRPRA